MLGVPELVQVPSRCTLAVGDAVVLVAHGGPPTADFALFDAGDIELRSTEPGTIREIGYRTTVGAARARLTGAGFTPSFAEEAAATAKPAAARAYARGAAARCVVDGLDGVELLESRAFDAATGAYRGTWLDLGALALDLGVAQAAALLRATYLAAYLAELPEDDDVVLATSEVSFLRRPGERTFRRVTLDDPRRLLDALATFRSRRARPRDGTAPVADDPGPERREVLRWLRERARQAPGARERLRELEVALGIREAPARGPLAETALWNVEARLARGETAGVAEQLDAIEQRRGRMPGSIYLRARTALMCQSEEARTIAERVSALSTSMSAFHELQLLAAQAWLAAGDARSARAFARDLLENAGADDVLRMHAHEVLEAAGESSASLPKDGASRPGWPAGDAREVVDPGGRRSADARDDADDPRGQDGAGGSTVRGHEPVHVIEPQPIFTVERPSPPSPSVSPMSNVLTPRPPMMDLGIPPPPRTPSGTDLDPIDFIPTPAPAPHTNTRPGFPAIPTRHSAPRHSSATTRTLPPGTSLPPYRVESRGERVWSAPPPHETELEPIETLSLPAGVHRVSPAGGEPPRTSAAARRTCTLLARELGRVLRERHGVAPRNDVEGLETAQRYLREALVEGRVRTPDEQREVMRQGGFLSELLARRLGARWVDLESPEAGCWAMLVPSRSRSDEVARVWPFARVLRFAAMGHKERDLVSYYLELEQRSR
jgi:hypothetical protein